MNRPLPLALAAALWAGAPAWAGPSPTPTPLPAADVALPAAPVMTSEADGASAPLRAAPVFDLTTLARTDEEALPAASPAWSGPALVPAATAPDRRYEPLTPFLTTPLSAGPQSTTLAPMTEPATATAPMSSATSAKATAATAVISYDDAGAPVTAFAMATTTSAATFSVEPSRQIISPSGRGKNGTQTFAKELALARNGIYYFDFVSTTSGLRTDLVKTGALSVAASAARPFTIALGTFNAAGASDFLNSSQFKASVNYSWTLVSATSFTGFSSSLFTLDTTAFRNDTAGGLFSVDQVGNNLVLNFTPVPEPSTWALLGVGALLVAWRGRRVLPPR